MSKDCSIRQFGDPSAAATSEAFSVFQFPGDQKPSDAKTQLSIEIKVGPRNPIGNEETFSDRFECASDQSGDTIYK